MPVRHDDQRIDFQHRHVFSQEGGVKLGDEALRLLGQVAGKSQRAGGGAAMMGHDPGRRIDGEAVDLFRRVVSDLLDVDPALGREDERHPALLPVDQRRKIELPVDCGAVLDVEAVDLLAVRTGLRRHQRRAQHLGRERLDLVDRAGEPHAALVARRGLLEAALAAAAGMDLALHHPKRPGELPRALDRLVRREGGKAGGDRDAERSQHRLGLIFVDVHGGEHLKEKRTPAGGGRRANDQPARAGLIALQASIRPWTEATDLANIAFSFRRTRSR